MKVIPKIYVLPEFREGLHYRQLEPRKEGRKKWRFATLREIKLEVNRRDFPFSQFFRDDEKVGLTFERNLISIPAGYAWNGCSPKRWFWPFGWMGTPDFKETILASLFHDAFYQFHAAEDFPLDRLDADSIFRQIIDLNGGEGMSYVYFNAVRAFGEWKI